MAVTASGQRTAKAGSSQRTPAADSGTVGRRHLVADLGLVLETLIAMRDSVGDIEHPPVAGAELGAEPMAEGRRAGAKIDHDIEDAAAGAADKLHLRMRLALIMHAAQSAAAGIERHAGLRDLRLQPAAPKFLLAIGSREKAAIVRHRLQVDEEHAADPCLGIFQGRHSELIAAPHSRRFAARTGAAPGRHPRRHHTSARSSRPPPAKKAAAPSRGFAAPATN